MLRALSTRVALLEIKNPRDSKSWPCFRQNTPISTPLWSRFLTKTAQRNDTLWGGT